MHFFTGQFSAPRSLKRAGAFMRSLIFQLIALQAFFGTASFAQGNDDAIKIVVPTAAEGSTDQLARILGAGLQDQGFGKVEVINMPGKSGTIAASFVAKSKPDGRTLLIATPSSHSIVKALSVASNVPLPYDPVASFSLIACFAQAPYIFVVGPDGPSSLSLFIESARKSSSPLKYSSTGIGGPHHLIGEALFGSLGLTLQHVPAAGGAKAIEMVKSNQVATMIPASILAIPQIQSGQIRALALTGTQRLAIIPSVPTFKELGISLDLESWYGLMGPSGLPVKQVESLANVVQFIMRNEATKKKLESLGINIVDIRNEAFAQMIEQETAIWQKVANQAPATHQ
jgi:tripartite-type tricarboxylate transporter receptor subunit TctC